MATSSKSSDRRPQKTREAIRQAFLEIVSEKGLMGASVQEVTERANISRGTFYAHYADKYALVDSIVREEFQKAVSTLPLDSGWNRKTLRLLIKTMLEYFKSIYQHHHRSREIAPLLEQAVHEELNGLVFSLLETVKKQEGSSQISLETIAQVVSWTIFGAAIQWSQKPTTLSSETMAQDITVMVMDGVGQLGIHPNEHPPAS